MEIDYEEEHLLFEESLKINNFDLKEKNDNEIKICEYLSDFNIANINEEPCRFKKIRNLFIRSIDDLGYDTKKYYKLVLPDIKTSRTRRFNNGYAEVIGNSKKQRIYVTRKPFKNVDFVAFSHELGHIPVLRNGARGEFFDYSEVLPIFFEYLTCKELYKDDAEKEFLILRLQMIVDEAKEYLKKHNVDCYDNEYHYLYLQDMKKENMKYIYSLEYVLSLIDIFKEDPEKVKEIIDSIVCKYNTFRDYEDELSVDTNNCNRILKLSNIC